MGVSVVTGADGAFLRRGRSIACDRRPVGRARCTPGRRAGTGAAGGCPRRCRSDQEAERQGSDGSGGGPPQRLESYKVPAAVAGSFCVRPAALTRSHRPDPRVDARHPRGSFALGGTDPSAAGRGGEGRSGVNPHTHTVRNPVPESLQHPEVLLVVRAPRICGAGGFLSLWQIVADCGRNCGRCGKIRGE